MMEIICQWLLFEPQEIQRFREMKMRVGIIYSKMHVYTQYILPLLHKGNLYLKTQDSRPEIRAGFSLNKNEFADMTVLS